MKYRTRKKKKMKNTIMILSTFILISIVITVGYARWQQNLTIRRKRKGSKEIGKSYILCSCNSME